MDEQLREPEETPSEEPNIIVPDNIDVFISYSQREVAYVSRLADALTEQGKVVWRDENKEDGTTGIFFGDDIWEVIARGLNNSDNLIFVASEYSLTSPWCNAELDHVRTKRKFPVLLLRDGETVPDAFSRIQRAIDAIPDDRTIPEFIDVTERNLRALANQNFTDVRGRLLIPVTEDALETLVEKLVDALEKDAEWARTYKDLHNAAIRWNNNGKKTAFLIVGDQLAEYLKEVTRNLDKEPTLGELDREFLEACQEQEQREVEAREGRLKNAQQARNRYLAIAALFLVGGIALAFVANTAIRSRAEANTRAEELEIANIDLETAQAGLGRSFDALATTDAERQEALGVVAGINSEYSTLVVAVETAVAEGDARPEDFYTPTPTMEPTPDPYLFLNPSPITCPGAPTSRLVSELPARVVGSRQNVQIFLRAGPSLGTEIIESMPIGSQIQVLEGPFCQDELAWWFVQIEDGRAGYISEGFLYETVDSPLVIDYFLEPVITPTPSPILPTATSAP